MKKMDSFLHLEYGFTIRIFPIFVYRYIRQKYQKQGERLSSSRLLKKRTRKGRFPSRGTFSRTGRTCYGFQILIRSKEEEEEEEEEEDDDDDDDEPVHSPIKLKPPLQYGQHQYPQIKNSSQPYRWKSFSSTRKTNKRDSIKSKVFGGKGEGLREGGREPF